MDSIAQDKVPPQNAEAEQATIGSILIDKNAIDKIADIVRADDFYDPRHAMVFEAILDLYEKSIPVDLLSLANRLEDRGQLERIGGRAYLTGLTNSVPTSSNVVHYANTVQRKATLRRLIDASAEIAAFGRQEEEDTDVVLDKAEQSLFKVSQKFLKNKFVAIKNMLPEVFDRIDELHRSSGKMRGLPTGFTDLDSTLAGLQQSDLLILAARPSVGKTSLALDIARQAAVGNKVPVGIFSLEMSKDQLLDRMLCAQANVDLWKMRTGRLNDDEDFANIGNAMGILSETPIFIDDSGTATVMEIRTKARRLKSEHGLGLLVIDYLQLIESRRSGSDNRVQEISEITRSLKGLARELNIPILALSQLSRAVESRTPPIPKLSDLRESGSIEQDADVVMFIYREALYKQDADPQRKNVAEVHIAKHRNGPVGKIELFFDENRASFKNLERRQATPPRDTSGYS